MLIAIGFLFVLTVGAWNPSPVQRGLLGRFDNRLQAEQDAAKGRPTAAQGGHEYVTAELVQHPNRALQSVIIAQYYLGTDVTRTFRLRCYEFCPSSNDSVVMRLYRPLPATEKIMRAAKYDWAHVSVLALQSFALPFGGELRKLTVPQLLQRDFEYLEGCDVEWRKCRTVPGTPIPLPPPFPSFFKGSLVQGSCRLCSQQDPNVILVAKDDLRLYRDQLDINDRCYTEDGKLVIGSTSGEPYRLRRIVGSE